MRWLTIGLLLFLSACASPPNPVRPSSAGTPAALASCRLPYLLQQPDGPTGPGFINVADGSFTADPGGAIVNDAAGDGFVDTVTAPVLHGPGGETYDRAVSRWVPVAADLISADGTRYAYSQEIPNPAGQGLGGPPPLGTRVHLVNVATGKDDVIYQTHDRLFAIAFRAEGIYLGKIDSSIDTVTPFHLLLLDVITDSVRQLLGGRTIDPPNGGFSIGKGSLWLVDVDATRPVVNARGQSEPNRLVRLTLSDGTQTTWFEEPKYSMQLVGVDLLDQPIVLTSEPNVNGSYGNWLVSGPNSAKLIVQPGFTGMVADTHGIWFTGAGVFLYTHDASVRQVSAKTGQLAGICG